MVVSPYSTNMDVWRMRKFDCWLFLLVEFPAISSNCAVRFPSSWVRSKTLYSHWTKALIKFLQTMRLPSAFPILTCLYSIDRTSSDVVDVTTVSHMLFAVVASASFFAALLLLMRYDFPFETPTMLRTFRMDDKSNGLCRISICWNRP